MSAHVRMCLQGGGGWSNIYVLLGLPGGVATSDTEELL